jgi:hypothetical protein
MEMRDEIGATAGKIWRTLGAKEEISLSQLPKMMKGKGELIYQALGWLACENKIAYRTKTDKVYVSLSDRERELFKKSK